MELKNYDKMYFVGIGGIGMSAIAYRFCKARFSVAGYDKTPSPITDKLINSGISVSFIDSVEHILPAYKKDKKKTIVIYTPAIPDDNKILKYFTDNNYTVIKRSEILGLLTKEKRSIAVAGTHGKTSISTMIAWIMNKTCEAFLGGLSINTGSNIIINPDAECVIVEADEFDRSFLTLYPQTAVITAIDADHLDIYKDFNNLNYTFHLFIEQIIPQGNLIYKYGLNINKNVNKHINYFTYSLDNNNADFYADDITIDNGFYKFTWNYPQGKIKNIILGIPGLYNLENAVAAIASAWLANINENTILKHTQQYKGVKRRFEYQILSDKVIYIDDYAHHPEEIKACINSVKHLFPGKTITGVFQPHLYSRTKDFADDFAESLENCDKIILTDIYPAREEPIPGVDSNIIFNKIKNTNKLLCKYSELTDKILKVDTDIIITMGAGDIDRLVRKIKNKLTEKYL
jgi:UDP-N-acetylmuramate--alanine ligase